VELLLRTAILDDVNDFPVDPLPYRTTVIAEKLPSSGPKSRRFSAPPLAPLAVLVLVCVVK